MKKMDDYNLSIVMPFYKRFNEFKKVFPGKSKYYQRNGIEVIIVMDEPGEQDLLLEYIRLYPYISWKVVVNPNDHEWRNPAKAFNAGIRQATKKYVLIMDPELEFYSDVIHILRQRLDSFPNHFAVGQVIFTSINQEVNEKSIPLLNPIPYGSIMAAKKSFEEIAGYDEGYRVWGGEDDNLRARFELAGIKKLFFPEALLIHREDYRITHTDRDALRKRIPFTELKKMLIPDTVIMNDKSWGMEFSNVILNWKDKPFARERFNSYMPIFDDYELQGDEVFNKRYLILALVPSYNEEQSIIGFIQHLEQHCDGFILMDDGSTDNTYNLVKSEKLILKVKKRRTQFNDLENRNILLTLASFFKAEWSFFIDVDERIDQRFETLREITQRKDIDVVGFWVINLWDDERYYKTNIEDSHSASKEGLLFRWRMFRNKGYMQLNTNRRLHFPTVPYISSTYNSSVLLKHYGCFTKTDRAEKYGFYQREDTEQYDNYGYLSDTDTTLRLVSEIKKSDLK